MKRKTLRVYVERASRSLMKGGLATIEKRRIPTFIDRRDRNGCRRLRETFKNIYDPDTKVGQRLRDSTAFWSAEPRKQRHRARAVKTSNRRAMVTIDQLLNDLYTETSRARNHHYYRSPVVYV